MYEALDKQGREYKIEIFDKVNGGTTVKTNSLKRLLSKKGGSEFEYIYAIQDYYVSRLLALEVGQKLPFKPNRDSDSEVGVITRVH